EGIRATFPTARDEAKIEGAVKFRHAVAGKDIYFDVVAGAGLTGEGEGNPVASELRAQPVAAGAREQYVYGYAFPAKRDG
ncbi:hypothetical protein KHT87_22860, partial [Alkalihalobacillus clausii]|uniref:hypothetical protein n=1 Tax=Shouchella clausii TaxID=79880 RepID=UPI001C0C204E